MVVLALYNTASVLWPELDQWWCPACSRACLERSLAVAARPKSPWDQAQRQPFRRSSFTVGSWPPDLDDWLTHWPNPSDFSHGPQNDIASHSAWGVRKSEWPSALEFIVEKMGAENLRLTQLRLGAATRFWLSIDSLGISSWFWTVWEWECVCVCFFFVALRQTNVGC